MYVHLHIIKCYRHNKPKRNQEENEGHGEPWKCFISPCASHAFHYDVIIKYQKKLLSDYYHYFSYELLMTVYFLH